MGYFQATVHSETSIDDDHKLVNVKFAVEMGERARISSVNVESADSGEQLPIAACREVYPGEAFRGLAEAGKTIYPDLPKAASQSMKRTLTGERRLACSIQEKPPLYNAATNRVDILRSK